MAAFNLPWFMGSMVAFDCETTGISITDDRIITIAAARLGFGFGDLRHWVIDPGVEIPVEASNIHGWTTARIREVGESAPGTLDDVAEILAGEMGSGVPAVGMNLAFDFSLLECELRRHNLPTLSERLDGRIGPVVDIAVLDKQVDRYRRGSRKLSNLAELYGVVLNDAHDAMADATASAEIARKIGFYSGEIGSMSVWDLHEAQVEWRAEQQTSLAGHFMSQGKEAEAKTVDGGWPLYHSVRTAVPS